MECAGPSVVVFDPTLTDYDFGPAHPMAPVRVDLTMQLAHELGHVLMNDPLHPDNVGPDRPWLLMDADSGRGTVDGPKRLRAADCQRMRETSRRARFPLLSAFDRADDAAEGGGH